MKKALALLALAVCWPLAAESELIAFKINGPGRSSGGYLLEIVSLRAEESDFIKINRIVTHAYLDENKFFPEAQTSGSFISEQEKLTITWKRDFFLLKEGDFELKYGSSEKAEEHGLIGHLQLKGEKADVKYSYHHKTGDGIMGLDGKMSFTLGVPVIMGGTVPLQNNTAR